MFVMSQICDDAHHCESKVFGRSTGKSPTKSLTEIRYKRFGYKKQPCVASPVAEDRRRHLPELLHGKMGLSRTAQLGVGFTGAVQEDAFAIDDQSPRLR
jgi:hypothetical protein